MEGQSAVWKEVCKEVCKDSKSRRLTMNSSYSVFPLLALNYFGLYLFYLSMQCIALLFLKNIIL